MAAASALAVLLLPALLLPVHGGAQNRTGNCIVATVAGCGTCIRGNVDGVGGAARFSLPLGLGLSPDGSTVFVADGDNHNMRSVVLATANVSTLATWAGTRATPGPDGVVMTRSGELFTLNSTCLMRVNWGATPVTDTVIACGLHSPEGLAADEWGNLYISDTASHCVRTLRAPVQPIPGDIPVFSGSCNRTSGGDAVDGSASAARFRYPYGLAVDNIRLTLLVGDSGNNAIRAVSLLDGSVTTRAGNLTLAALNTIPPANAGNTDGLGGGAQFNGPSGIAVDESTGNAFVVDFSNHAVRLVTPEGWTATIAGTGNRTSGWIDGPGEVARLHLPLGIAVAPATATLYIADSANHALRSVVCPGLLAPYAPPTPTVNPLPTMTHTPGYVPGGSGGGGNGPLGPMVGVIPVGGLVILLAGILSIGAGGAFAGRRYMAGTAGGGSSSGATTPRPATPSSVSSPYRLSSRGISTVSLIGDWGRGSAAAASPTSPTGPRVATIPSSAVTVPNPVALRVMQMHAAVAVAASAPQAQV